MIRRLVVAFTCLVVATTACAGSPEFIGLGDSIGEGVQSADANASTQPNTYLALVAAQLGDSFTLPLIRTSPLGVVGSTMGRSRIDPAALTADLAVSGADSDSILTDSAGWPVDDETDLVELPRAGTQIQIAQRLRPPLIACWIGNNDVLGAALAFDRMDASQITPQDVFADNFQAIADGLTGWNDDVVFANIPDVTRIGFLMSPEDLKLFLGDSYGLPEGSYTSLVAMLTIRMGLLPPTILRDPSWVLDATEIAKMQAATAGFNRTIAADAAAAGMPVVDIHSLMNAYAAHPPVIDGVPLLLRYNGGLLSLDGVHPSDIGHALIANAFIRTMNATWHTNVPPLSQAQLTSIAHADPFIDWNGDLVVRGRPLRGLLETLGPTLGISGDQPWQPGIRPELGRQFMRAYFAATGRSTTHAGTQQDAIAAMRHAFGLDGNR
ncbi:MAG TPA: SGNH/GDSL hydrolase family protein [Rhodanobacteraceae bacterium]